MKGSTKRPEPSGGDPPRLSRLFEALAGDVVLRFVAGRRVLDLGHGSDEVLQWVRSRAATPPRVVELEELDPGEEDLGLARLGEGCFDVVYSLQTFPHLGDSAEASEEMARRFLAATAKLVTVNGLVLVQLTNPRSLRGLASGIRHPITLMAGSEVVLRDHTSVTRYDTLSRLASLLPKRLEIARIYGIGVLTPNARILSVPLVGRIVERAEWHLHGRRWLSHFGAQILVVCRRLPNVPG
ncbi:MAG: hypothetical protein V3V08_17905 [Nannocystaceae bacterium]